MNEILDAQIARSLRSWLRLHPPAPDLRSRVMESARLYGERRRLSMVREMQFARLASRSSQPHWPLRLQTQALLYSLPANSGLSII